MKPKTQIRYSRIYNCLFDKNFSREDFIKLKQNSKKFEELYEKYIEQILKLIEKYHRKEWKYKFIPIYIVNEKAPYSFSDPLTLRYLPNPKSMLVVLSHELLHNNLAGKWKFKDSYELHKYMEPVLNKIILDLPIDLSRELELFNKKTLALAKKNSK